MRLPHPPHGEAVRDPRQDLPEISPRREGKVRENKGRREGESRREKREKKEGKKKEEGEKKKIFNLH